MNYHVLRPGAAPGARSSRVLTSGRVELDEARGELRVRGERRAIEAKPLALLHALLTSADAIVSKRAMMAAAWGNADHISEASLTTAISKLRTALGGERSLIEVVHGQGYRLSLPVEIRVGRDPDHGPARLRTAQPVPGRPGWHLRHQLGANDEWLAENETGAERRVFKFADNADGLAALEREVAIAEQVQAAAAGGDEIVPIIDWNFDEPPYFIERPYCGPSLAEWAGSANRLQALDLAVRLAMMARLARILAAAHSAGVLHGDIGPDTILVDETIAPGPRLRLASFPEGPIPILARSPDAADFPALQQPASRQISGTSYAIAPEILRGGIATTAADIYALGILLYQITMADLGRPLAAGWESDISDVLLREDIAAAAAGDPARRIESASMLARRLETLPQRHLQLRQRAQQEVAQARLLHQLERNRVRQPWIIGAGVSALAAIILCTAFGIQAVQKAELAGRRAALAQAVNTFLTEDLLGRGNPALSGRADETLMQAATAAEASIDRRLGSEPLTAGTIFLSLADAFASRSAFPAAADAYQRAIAAFGHAGVPGAAPSAIARLKEGAMLVTWAQPDSMARAQALIAAARPQIATVGDRAGEANVWLHNALAMQQMMGGDLRIGQMEFGRAASGAEALPRIFDEATRLTLRRREAFVHLRLGDWSVARDMMQALLQRQRAVTGIAHPDTLQLELNLAQVQLVLGESATALSALDRIYPDFVAVFGPGHRLTLGLLGERANALANLGRYGEAFADQMQAYHIAAAKDGDHSFVALGSLTDAAQSRCRSGQPDPGLSLASEAYDSVKSSFGAESLLAQAAGGNLALCLIADGQPAAAAPFLDRIDTRLVTQMNLDLTYGAQLDLMRAAIFLAADNLQAGRSLLTKVAPVFARRGADPYMHRWAADLLRQYCPGC